MFSLIFVIVPIWLMVCVFLVPWSLLRIFASLRTYYSKLLFGLSIFYGGLTLIKLFTALVEDSRFRGYNFVLKLYPSILNTLYQIPSDVSMEPDGPGVGLIIAGKWYASGHYKQIAILASSEISLYRGIIASWWIITFVIVPIWGFILYKKSKRNEGTSK